MQTALPGVVGIVELDRRYRDRVVLDRAEIGIGCEPPFRITDLDPVIRDLPIVDSRIDAECARRSPSLVSHARPGDVVSPAWREINIEAPIARAFLDRGLVGPSHVITVGALAGLTSVMLVMLLGQTRVLYSMANDGLLPKKVFAEIHPKYRTPWKNTWLVGMLAAVVGSVTPIDDIGKMVNIGTLLAFVIVCIAVIVLRITDPKQPRPFRTPWVPLVPLLGVVFNGYMMYELGWLNWARLLIWLAIGLVIYFMYGQKHSRVQAALRKASGR